VLRADTFSEPHPSLAELTDFVESVLKENGFLVKDKEAGNDVVDIHARKGGARNAARGAVRDVDAVIAQKGAKLQVQLRVGIWGKDLIVPALEAIPTVGLAAAEELRSAHELEKKMWEKVVHHIGPALRICELDGMTFATDEDLKLHMDMHRMLREVHQVQRMEEETNLIRQL
jgi:hypothetical protein